MRLREGCRTCQNALVAFRQKVMLLYLADSNLEASVVAWTQWDGTGETQHMSGDADAPPYPTGLDALLDGWRLFQLSPLRPEESGQEFRTSYLKYEFAFERWVELPEGGA
jgi:hypothetical protein